MAELRGDARNGRRDVRIIDDRPYSDEDEGDAVSGSGLSVTKMTGAIRHAKNVGDLA